MQTMMLAIVVVATLVVTSQALAIASLSEPVLIGYIERPLTNEIKVYFDKPSGSFTAEVGDGNGKWSAISQHLESSVPQKSSLELACSGKFDRAYSVIISTSDEEFRIKDGAGMVRLNVKTPSGVISSAEC